MRSGGTTREELVATLQRRRKVHADERRQREALYAEQKRILMEDQEAVLKRTLRLEDEATELCSALADVRQKLAEEKYCAKLEADEEAKAHAQMTASLREMLEDMATQLEAAKHRAEDGGDATAAAAGDDEQPSDASGSEDEEASSLPEPELEPELELEAPVPPSEEAAKRTSSAGRKHPKLDASSITKSNVWGAILSDSTSTNWVVAGFEENSDRESECETESGSGCAGSASSKSNKVVVQAYGGGDVVAGVRAAVSDGQVHFGGFRVTAIEQQRGHRGAAGVRAKFVYFVWVGAEVRGVLRGTWSAADAVVRKRFPGVHLSLHLTEREHMNCEAITQKLFAATRGGGNATLDFQNEHMAAMAEWRVAEVKRRSSGAAQTVQKESWWRKQQPAVEAVAAKSNRTSMPRSRSMPQLDDVEETAFAPTSPTTSISTLAATAAGPDDMSEFVVVEPPPPELSTRERLIEVRVQIACLRSYPRCRHVLLLTPSPLTLLLLLCQI
jgi:hypothetical protein